MKKTPNISRDTADAVLRVIAQQATRDQDYQYCCEAIREILDNKSFSISETRSAIYGIWVFFCTRHPAQCFEARQLREMAQ